MLYIMYANDCNKKRCMFLKKTMITKIIIAAALVVSTVLPLCGCGETAVDDVSTVSVQPGVCGDVSEPAGPSRST